MAPTIVQRLTISQLTVRRRLFLTYFGGERTRCGGSSRGPVVGLLEGRAAVRARGRGCARPDEPHPQTGPPGGRGRLRARRPLARGLRDVARTDDSAVPGRGHPGPAG